MPNNYQLGLEGEQIAVDYLVQKGYRILERRWKYLGREIDIIAQLGEYVVVVEVKARSTAAFGRPENAVNNKKQKRLIEAIHFYITHHRLNLEVRFDIIGIIKERGKIHILHTEDAFVPL